MRGLVPMLLVAAILTGCGRTPKVDNPVMGPPPPRVSLNDSTPRQIAAAQREDGRAGEGTVIRTSLVGNAKRGDRPAGGADVVARVNGEPIFAGDILEPYQAHFDKQAKQLSPARMARVRRELVKRDLKSHVERRLLVQALRRQFKKEQFASVQKRLDELFDEEMQKMFERYDVGSHYELAQAIEKEGQSLEALQRTFNNQQLAMLYLGQNVKREFDIGRPELIGYYNAHIEDYTLDEKVRWQRLQVRFGEHGGQSGALEHYEKAIADLKAGVPFDDVVRKYSDGSRARSGGNRDWTKRGSLRNERVENAIFTLPIGVVSEPFVDDDSYQLVRVTERRKAGYVKFETVQDEIREAIETKLRKAETDRVLADLRNTAEITTVFDGEESTEDSVKLPFR